MEVRQRMEFTGTNSSIGLNALINHAHSKSLFPLDLPKAGQLTQKSHHAFADLVVMAELLHPIPFRTRP
jgi:hypothetical protein